VCACVCAMCVSHRQASTLCSVCVPQASQYPVQCVCVCHVCESQASQYPVQCVCVSCVYVCVRHVCVCVCVAGKPVPCAACVYVHVSQASQCPVQCVCVCVCCSHADCRPKHGYTNTQRYTHMRVGRFEEAPKQGHTNTTVHTHKHANTHLTHTHGGQLVLGGS